MAPVTAIPGTVAGTLWLGDTSHFGGGEELQEEQEGKG